HLIARLMSARLPSSSRHTMPISSATLAWRTFVTTGYFWASCQITGVVMRRGGNINQRRVFCTAFSSGRASEAFLVLIGMGAFLYSRNGGDDADFVTVFQSGLLVLQKANIFFVDVHVDEPPHRAGFVHQPFFDAGVTGLQLADGFTHGAGGDLDDFFVVGQFS